MADQVAGSTAAAGGRSLAEEVAVITGATSGIGRATTELFVREGARVVMVARNARDAASAHGEATCFVAGDVADPDTAKRAVAAAESRWGPVSVLVNNAAVDHTGNLLDTDLAAVEQVMRTNVVGPLVMLQVIGRRMRRLGGGSVVNITSRLATVGVPTMGIYGASKGALLSLTRHAAVELAADGIRVNAVAPGFAHTGMYDSWLADGDPTQRAAQALDGIPQNRLAEPAEVAAAVAFLASRAASHVTGASLAVDGGYTAR